MQIFAVDILHGQIRQSFDFADVVHTANIGVRHLPRDSDFVMKPAERAAIARHFNRQEFQRYRLAEPQIGCPVDFAHTARAEQIDDSETIAEQGSRDEASFFR